jgi:hypothetical protein
VLSNVIRSTQKGPFTSTDGLCRKFTDDAEVDLQFLVEKHKEDIAKGKRFAVDSRHDAVLACVFYSLPTEVLAARYEKTELGQKKKTGLFVVFKKPIPGSGLWAPAKPVFFAHFSPRDGAPSPPPPPAPPPLPLLEPFSPARGAGRLRSIST